MRIALTQMDIVWEDKAKNRVICEILVEKAAAQNAEIIIFPEMTLTGFTMKPEIFGEEQHGETEKFFQTLSDYYGIAIVFGCIEKRKDNFFNVLEMTAGKNTLMKYAKIHPFSYGEESRHYGKGEKIVSACYKGTYLGGFICYDLRFPEVFQISSGKNQILFVIANWPESRVDHWRTLLKARAIENQCFMIGVNRTGEGNGLFYPASSMVFDPYGNSIAYVPGAESCGQMREPELLYADIDLGLAEQYRRDFPVKEDRREELYKKEIILSNIY